MKDALNFSYSHIDTDSFKTSLCSITFITPLKSETAAANALAIRLLEGCAADCENKKEFSRVLSDLYGTKISSEVIKDADNQVLRLVISYLDDEFLPNGEKIRDKISNLVCNLVFGYKLKAKGFDGALVNQEKRLLCEEIAGNLNDKRIYARKRAEEIACEGEPYSLQPIGTINEVEGLSADDIYAAYERLLSSAYIHLQTVGRLRDNNLENAFKTNLSKIERLDETKFNTVVKSAKDTKTVTEKFPVNQGKLVMAFRCDSTGDDITTAPFFMMSDIFGGAPYAKLFVNVREKMSLCYYCSARPVKKKGLIFVESGVEAQNIEKAIKAITEQFESIKQGDFDDELIGCSKRASLDALKALYSNQSTLDRWYAMRSMSSPKITTRAFADALNKVTKEDITRIANKVSLDTVYILRPQEGQ